MSKRKYPYSSSDDSDSDSSSQREKEQLKALFCSYIDRLSRKRRKKKKIFSELTQSLCALPSTSPKKNTSVKKNALHKLRETDSSGDEKASSPKQNLKNFFEKRISMLCQAHKKPADFMSDLSDSSDSVRQLKKSDSMKNISILKGQSARMVLKDRLSNHRKQELVKKWRDKHFEKESVEINDTSTDLLLESTKPKLKALKKKDVRSSTSLLSSVMSINAEQNIFKEKSNLLNNSSRESSVNNCHANKDEKEKGIPERRLTKDLAPNVESQDTCISTSQLSKQNVDSSIDVGEVSVPIAVESQIKRKGTEKRAKKRFRSKANSELSLDFVLKDLSEAEENVKMSENISKVDAPRNKKNKKKSKQKCDKSHHKIKSPKHNEEGPKKSLEIQPDQSKKKKLSCSETNKRMKDVSCHNSERISISKELEASNSRNHRSRTRDRMNKKAKAKNQLEICKRKDFESSYEEDLSDEFHNRHYKGRDRQSRPKRPKVKRVRNFLSLNSSVEEVYSENEALKSKEKFAPSRDDTSPSTDLSSRERSDRKAHHKWSGSSELSKCSSKWQVDVEKQKPYKRRDDSQENDQVGVSEFKKKSCDKIKERLKQSQAEESSANESTNKKVSKSADNKPPKVVIDLEESLTVVNSSSDTSRKGNEPRLTCQDNERDKNIREQKNKTDDKVLSPGHQIDSKSIDKSADCKKRKSAMGDDISREEHQKAPETPQEFEVVTDNASPNENHIEQNLSGRAPLKISFKPRAILKNVNKLAEASIKCASQKFNFLYGKKGSKNCEITEEHIFGSMSPYEENKKKHLQGGVSGKDAMQNGEAISVKCSDLMEMRVQQEKNKVVAKKIHPGDEQSHHISSLNRSEDASKKRGSMGSGGRTSSTRSSSRSSGCGKSFSRRRSRSSTHSSYRSYSSRSRDRSRRRRSYTYSSRSPRGSYYSRNRSRSYSSRSYLSSRRRHHSRRRYSSFSSYNSSVRYRDKRWRSISQRRHRSYSSSVSRRGNRRLRSYKDWSSFSSYSSRSRSYSRSVSRSTSRRSRYVDQKKVKSKWDRSDSLKSTAESAGADSEIGSKANSENAAREGHLTFECGDVLGDRYEILSTLGSGTFSKVVECVDRKSNKHVALKIIRNVPKYKEAAELEIGILKDIVAKDPHDENFCIQIRSTFEHFNHQCLVFDALGLSLYEFLKNNSYQPYTLEQIRHVGYQMLLSVK